MLPITSLRLIKLAYSQYVVPRCTIYKKELITRDHSFFLPHRGVRAWPRSPRNVTYHSRRIKIHRGSDDSGIKIHRNATAGRVHSRVSRDGGPTRENTPKGAGNGEDPEWDATEFTGGRQASLQRKLWSKTAGWSRKTEIFNWVDTDFILDFCEKLYSDAFLGNGTMGREIDFLWRSRRKEDSDARKPNFLFHFLDNEM